MDVVKFSETVELIEDIIESERLSCRVFAANRSAIALGTLVGGVTSFISLLGLIGIGIHNLLTFNPDYLIIKYPLSDTIDIVYEG